MSNKPTAEEVKEYEAQLYGLRVKEIIQELFGIIISVK